MVANKIQLKNIILLIVSIVLLSSGGIFVRLTSAPPIATGFYRVLFSIPILYFFVRKDLKTVQLKDNMYMLIAGAFFGLDLVFWNTSFHNTTIANVNLISNFVVFTMAPVAYFVFKEKIPKFFPVAVLIVIIGIIILTYGKIKFSMHYLKGDVFALISSVSYAIFLLMIYRVRNRVSGSISIFVSAFSASLVLFVAMYLVEGLFIPNTPHALIPIIVLTLSSQILGIGLLAYSLPRVSIFLSSLLLLLQPILGGIFAFFIFNETLMINEIIGMVIVLIGIYISNL